MKRGWLCQARRPVHRRPNSGRTGRLLHMCVPEVPTSTPTGLYGTPPPSPQQGSIRAPLPHSGLAFQAGGAGGGGG